MANVNSDLRTVANADGAAVLNIGQGTISTLNVTGAYLWEALGRGASTEAIVRELVEKTGESEEVIAADVQEFLSALKAHDLTAQ